MHIYLWQMYPPKNNNCNASWYIYYGMYLAAILHSARKGGNVFLLELIFAKFNRQCRFTSGRCTPHDTTQYVAHLYIYRQCTYTDGRCTPQHLNKIEHTTTQYLAHLYIDNAHTPMADVPPQTLHNTWHIYIYIDNAHTPMADVLIIQLW